MMFFNRFETLKCKIDPKSKIIDDNASKLPKGFRFIDQSIRQKYSMITLFWFCVGQYENSTKASIQASI